MYTYNIYIYVCVCLCVCVCVWVGGWVGVGVVCVIFTAEGFLEVAIESWPEWDLNQRPLNSVQTL